MYDEEEFLQLSGIQHFAFCRRQWALAYIELQWLENVRTVEGRLLHEKAHDSSIKEKRGELIITRALPVHSRELGVSGECDVVEFHQAEEGISLSGIEGKYKVVPIEYKKGIPKADDIDAVQLAAQSMCLEEMHKYYEQRYTPKVKWSKRCNACSLKDVCVPALNKSISAAGYIERKIKEEEGIP